MRVLLTGATGFIGSHTAHELIERGHDVLALMRPESDTERLNGILGRSTRIDCDLLAPTLPSLQNHPADVLLHLAWYCHPSDYRSSAQNTQWPSASMRLLEAAAKAGCKRVLMAGTCFEYASGRGVFAESDPIVPLNLYAASKHALHIMAESFCRAHGIELVWARPFYLYGPQENANRLVPYVINKLLNSQPCPLTKGEQVRDFLHVRDVASAFCDAVLSRVEGPLNIGSSEPVTVRDIAVEIGSQTGRTELLQLGAQPYLPNEPPFLCADNSKLKRETSWSAHYALKAGIADSISWWRSQRAAA